MKILLSVIGAFSLIASGYAQQTTKVITVNDPRPLSEAILKLEKASGQPITYEDPVYSYSADVVDRSDSFRHAPGVKVLLPKGGLLNFAFMPSEVSDRPGTAKVLQRLVTTFNKSYPDGAQFTLLDQDGLFHVIPRSSRSASGGVGPHASPLDVPLTVVEKDVNGEVALTAILAAINATTGMQIWEGNIMMDFSRAKLSISSDKETGRTLLTQFLQTVDPSLSWQLLTGAGPEPGYFLNIHQVQR
jgi:hypothetical protein